LLDRHRYADPRHLWWRRRPRGRLMTPALLPLLVGVPLIAAALLAVLHRAPPWLRRPLYIAPSAAGLLAWSCLMWRTRAGWVLADIVGLWKIGISIPFVVDVFSALMLWATALLILVCSAFASVVGDDERPFFSAVVMVLYAGVSGALMTGDVFNMFVFIEVML